MENTTILTLLYICLTNLKYLAMKITLLIPLLFIFGYTFSQTNSEFPVDKNDKITYLGEIRTNFNKRKSFDNAKQFFYSTDKSPKLQTLDGEIYKIIYNHSGPLHLVGRDKTLNYTFKVLVEDSIIKYKMTDLEFGGVSKSFVFVNQFGFGSAHEYTSSIKPLENRFMGEMTKREKKIFAEVDKLCKSSA